MQISGCNSYLSPHSVFIFSYYFWNERRFVMADFSEMTVLVLSPFCAVTVSNVGLFQSDLVVKPDYFSNSWETPTVFHIGTSEVPKVRKVILDIHSRDLDALSWFRSICHYRFTDLTLWSPIVKKKGNLKTSKPSMLNGPDFVNSSRCVTFNDQQG